MPISAKNEAVWLITWLLQNRKSTLKRKEREVINLVVTARAKRPPARHPQRRGKLMVLLDEQILETAAVRSLMIS